MTTLHSTTLLNEPASTAPRAPQHVRSVTHVAPRPVQASSYAQQQWAPQPQVVSAAPSGSGAGSAVSALVLGLIVVLLGAIAFVGAYAATRQAAPTGREAALTQGLAMRDAFRSGRERGVVAGHEQALASSGTTTALRVAAAREQAWNAAFRRGERAGRRSYRAPRYTGGSGYGSRAPRYRSGGTPGLYQAFGAAQALANTTGAAVDVEIY